MRLVKVWAYSGRRCAQYLRSASIGLTAARRSSRNAVASQQACFGENLEIHVMGRRIFRSQHGAVHPAISCDVAGRLAEAGAEQRMIEEDVPGANLICFSPNYRAIGCARIRFADDGLDAANDHRIRNCQNHDHRQHDRYHMSQAKIPKPNQPGDKCADGDDRAARIGQHHTTENSQQCQQRQESAHASRSCPKVAEAR